MSLFLDAAEKWSNLLDVTYSICIGHKGQNKILQLVFREDDFDHLSGMQYVKDVDFKLHRNEYRGRKLLQAVFSNKIDPTLIEKSAEWPRISCRLNGIQNIREFLNSDFKIYEFSARKLPFFSKISASYVLYNSELKEGLFLFLDKDASHYYCKSIFMDEMQNYTANQTNWVVLKKDMVENGSVTCLYLNPSYKEEVSTMI